MERTLLIIYIMQVNHNKIRYFTLVNFHHIISNNIAYVKQIVKFLIKIICFTIYPN